jgi:hypothetical protein
MARMGMMLMTNKKILKESYMIDGLGVFFRTTEAMDEFNYLYETAKRKDPELTIKKFYERLQGG